MQKKRWGTRMLAAGLAALLSFSSIDFTVFAEEQTGFSQTVRDGQVEISVTAPEGVFPEGASLSVNRITEKGQVAQIEQLVTAKEEESAPADEMLSVDQTYSYDITIFDSEGNAIEPDTSRGEVSVSFKHIGDGENQQEDNQDISVYYVTDDYSRAEEIPSESDGTSDSAVISAEHFSIYTVVITSGEKKDTVLHYYQGTSKENSYFTIYNGVQLQKYRELLDGFVRGTVKNTDSIDTILVNSDDSNPTDGITGLGQAADLTLADLNFSVRIMDDITVTDAWTPIEVLPDGVVFDGNGHTITFQSLASGVSWNGNGISVLITSNEGTLKNKLVLVAAGKTYTRGQEEAAGEEYATVTVRIDGEKSEIGEAITGAEALAASCDGKHYITLERDDDLAVYRTPLENLYPKDEETGEVLEAYRNKTYKVYYVYEDENETISAATLTENKFNADLTYVSVAYDLEGANTYKEENGELSENVMSAVRMDVNPDGSYVAQDDYDAVLVPAAGYEVPTREKNVTISVDGKALSASDKYTYTYDAHTKQSKIHIHKSLITGPMTVTVRADSVEDVPPTRVILKTRGGSISDSLWDKTSDGMGYEQELYEGQSTTLPSTVMAYKGSDAIKFAGWYDNASCTGTPVTKQEYVASASNSSVIKTYYAKWVLAKQESTNNTVYYGYMSSGNLDVRGYPKNADTSQVTFGNGGFYHKYSVGELSSGQEKGTQGGTELQMPYTEGEDIFVKIPGTSIYVAMICTLEGSLVDISYIFENRGSTDFSSKLYYGDCADVQIAGNDSATVSYVGSSVKYIKMYDRYADKEFRLYTTGSDFGISDMYSSWCGRYDGYQNHIFSNVPDSEYKDGNDSALCYSWYINNVPAGGYITKTTKMGLTAVSTMSNITAKLDAGSGKFSDGSNAITLTSKEKKIVVETDGTVKTYSSAGSYSTTQPPTRTGYKFSHWSLGAEGGKDVTANGTKTYTEGVNLYANYTPQPDKAVTNNCSVQKVNGSDNLLVPEALGNIVIENKTPGSSESDRLIAQGKTVSEAAGYASGFSCVLKMAGSDDRYLLPDNIDVTITAGDGTRTKLTKGTGYTYTVYDNRRKADLNIEKRYINGDVTITAVGYELPPVTATSVEVKVPNASISYGDRAVFTATATTSKNHIASYQWYIAPYYEIELDNKLSWTYQNQNGVPLKNGTYVCGEWNESGKAITVSGANKATMRISGLDVNTFGEHGEKSQSGISYAEADISSMNGLKFGGYHVYCVVTSTRNITGQEIVATSDTAELQVVKGTYQPPEGLEGSATTYWGSSDGSIAIESGNNGATLLYRKKGAKNWSTVTESQIAAGEIVGLGAGDYEFKYKQDANHRESDITTVTVDNGRYITVTYRAAGCDDESLLTQYKYVAYGTTVTQETVGMEGDSVIQEPTRTGYSFRKWDKNQITNIKEDTTVNAVYACGVYKIALDNQDADSQGTQAIYEAYSKGFYKDADCSNRVNSTTGITVPTKTGYDFLGYYTNAEEGTRMINADGCLSGELSPVAYTTDTTLYAHWQAKNIGFDVSPTVDNPQDTTPDKGNVDVDVKPENPEDAGEGYRPDVSYEVTVTNDTGKKANVIYIYSDGVLKKTLTDVIFDASHQYKFTLIPNEVGGGNITFVVGYVEETTEDGNQKTDEEIKHDTEEQAKKLNYDITYKDASAKTEGGNDFSGSFNTTAPKKGINGVVTILPTATRTGYTFGGWFTSEKGTGKPITEISAEYTDDEVVVYAKWIANKYNITLVTNGGTYVGDYTPREQYQHGGTDVSLPDASQIVKENYTFLGWYDNKDLLGDAVSELDASTTGEKTYYAGWELLPAHSITLTDDGSRGTVYQIAGMDGYGFDRDGVICVYDGKEYKGKWTAFVGREWNLHPFRSKRRQNDYGDNGKTGFYRRDSGRHHSGNDLIGGWHHRIF